MSFAIQCPVMNIRGGGFRLTKLVSAAKPVTTWRTSPISNRYYHIPILSSSSPILGGAGGGAGRGNWKIFSGGGGGNSGPYKELFDIVLFCLKWFIVFTIGYTPLIGALSAQKPLTNKLKAVLAENEALMNGVQGSSIEVQIEKGKKGNEELMIEYLGSIDASLKASCLSRHCLACKMTKQRKR